MTPAQRSRLTAAFYLAWPFVPVVASFWGVTHYGVRDAAPGGAAPCRSPVASAAAPAENDAPAPAPVTPSARPR